ncbi:unnamed protein product, partial [Gulo gulo]
MFFVLKCPQRSNSPSATCPSPRCSHSRHHPFLSTRSLPHTLRPTLGPRGGALPDLPRPTPGPPLPHNFPGARPQRRRPPPPHTRARLLPSQFG